MVMFGFYSVGGCYGVEFGEGCLSLSPAGASEGFAGLPHIFGIRDYDL